MIINSEHFEKESALAIIDAASIESAERIVQTMELGFAGLLWFVGRQLRRMLAPTNPERAYAQGVTPLPTGVSLDGSGMQDIVICLGGRPSLILKDILQKRHAGRDRRAGNEGEAFQRLFLRAAGLERTGPGVSRVVRFDYSDKGDAKREVAFGLLAEDNIFKPEALVNDTILGEAGSQGGQDIPADTFLRSPTIDQSRPVLPAIGAPEMETFFDCLAEISRDATLGTSLPRWRPTETQMRNAVRLAGNTIADAFAAVHPENGRDAPAAQDRRKDAPTMEVQPPFFAILHELMKEMVRV